MIAQANVVAMEGIDQIEVTPHEPIAAIYLVEAALSDAGPGVEIAPSGEAILLEGLRRHATRLKWDPVVAVTIVEPPFAVKQTALGLQPTVKGGARKRSEMVEGGYVKSMFFRELNGGSEALQGIAIVPKNEGAVHTDAMPAQIRQGLLKTPTHGVERLVHVTQVFGIQALETDQYALTSAADEEVKELFVVSGVDARLAHPADVQRNQGAKEFLRHRQVGRDVVVYKEEQFPLPLQRLDFGDNPVGGPSGLSGIEHGLDGAEVAFEMATAPGLNQPDWEVTFVAKDRAVRV